jgi:hypothetical protein
MKRGLQYAQQHKVAPLKKFVGHAAPKTPRRPTVVSYPQLVLVALLSFLFGVITTLLIAAPAVVEKLQQTRLWP